jgi:hypothetical protein
MTMGSLGKGLAVLVSLTLLCSCEDDDDVSLSKFIGTWRIDDSGTPHTMAPQHAVGATNGTSSDALPSQITFSTDRTYVAVYANDEVLTGPFTFGGGVVRLTNGKGELVCTLSQGVLRLSLATPNGPSVQSLTRQPTVDSIVGTWRLVWASHGPDFFREGDGYDSPSLLVFFADGRMYGELVRGQWSNYDQKGWKTYFVNGDRLTVVPGEEGDNHLTFSIANNTLTTQQPADDDRGGIYRMVFTRTSVDPVLP